MARSSSIPASLPPPYTATGTQASSLRKDPQTFTSTTELLIGSSPSTRFLLHTHLLTSQSPYFRAALSGPYLESQNQRITLNDIQLETFELLVSWLYTGAITPIPFKDGRPAYYTLLHLYILADRLCFEGLRNTIIDLISELADSTNSVLTPSDTRILYDHIAPYLPIRKLILDLFAFKKTEKLLQSHDDRWHAHFLRDLCVHLKKPCEQAMQRHRLAMWYPIGWRETRACESCRAVIPPRYGSVRCEECGVVWCTRCVGEGTAVAGWEDGNPGRFFKVKTGAGEVSGNGDVEDGGGGAEDEQMVTEIATGKKVKIRKWVSCKPWRGSRCLVYHEHDESERCGEIFMGH